MGQSDSKNELLTFVTDNNTIHEKDLVTILDSGCDVNHRGTVSFIYLFFFIYFFLTLHQLYQTAFMIICEKNLTNIARILIEYGANPLLLDYVRFKKSFFCVSLSKFFLWFVFGIEWKISA